MTKPKLKRAVGGSSDRWVQLPHYLLKSQAWRTMPSAAKALLIEVWVRHNGVNNGEISFACREASKLLGCSIDTVSRMFDILIERGFLVIVCDACFGLGALRPNHAAANQQPKILCVGILPLLRCEPAKNHSTVRLQVHHSPITGTQDGKLTETVRPQVPSGAIPGDPQSDYRYTYNLPCTGGGVRRRGEAARIPATWTPAVATTRAATADGLRYGDVFRAVERFRLHHLASGAISADWDAEWLASLRAKSSHIEEQND